MKLVKEIGPTTEGPWLGDFADTGNLVVTKSDAKEMLVGRDQIGTSGKPRLAPKTATDFTADAAPPSAVNNRAKLSRTAAPRRAAVSSLYAIFSLSAYHGGQTLRWH